MHQYLAIESACESFGVPIPDAVTKAATLAATFEAALDKAQRSGRPEVAEIVAATTAALEAGDKPAAIDKAITAAVDDILSYDERHAARVDVLRRLVSHASGQVDLYWRHAVPSVAAELGPIFDREVERFLAASVECGEGMTAEQALASDRAEAWRTMTDSAAKLSHLRTVRRELALAESTAPLATGSLEEWSLIAMIDEGDTWARRIPARLSGLPIGGREWWLALAQMPGVQLKWAPTRAEADARAEETLRHTKRIAVARESVIAGQPRPTAGERVPGPPAGVATR